jgi:hypothetical protein
MIFGYVFSLDPALIDGFLPNAGRWSVSAWKYI